MILRSLVLLFGLGVSFLGGVGLGVWLCEPGSPRVWASDREAA